MSPIIPPNVAAHMRRQHGIVTSDQLRAGGVSDWTRRRLVRDELFIPVHSGVYRSSATEATFRSSCLAAVLAGVGGAVSGPSAGVLYGLRKVHTSEVHLMVGRRGVRLEGVVVHVSTAFADGDTQELDGITVLRPTRLAPDLARFLDDDDLESVIEQLLERGMATAPGLHAMARRLRVQGRDGIQRYLRVLDRRPAWRRPAGSDLELRFIRELRRRGLAVEQQVRFDFPDGTHVVFDAADRERRLAIEVDHASWHGGRVRSQADKLRDRRVLAAGWTTVRVTDHDVEHRLHAAVDEVEAVFRALRAG